MIAIEVIILLLELIILAVIWSEKAENGKTEKTETEREKEEPREEKRREDWNEGMKNMMAWTYEDAIKAAREEREHGRL
ncbi:MAG: hypothetical protein IJP67_03245 [Oscillospiraceae bacterium]|nr:hypothetical protein [Oscillospiraceae bacterium]MBR0063158.1 hypothetical protein [Oscillospiraceae bacterium]